ncbi:hypothetical protein HLK59_20160 [Streptomyces sp. S3(2020)]|uniref:hypothetical protein n=1 Tax=Streptomyces sp. S3(2020) TaxID=2732044 RepID=UPI001489E714|nr:hypothetical protein [Streptomyces sp. S3(2020)]NNN32636.1 hypothetical protein [Streptomyces sp. S3(2020)]
MRRGLLVVTALMAVAAAGCGSETGSGSGSGKEMVVEGGAPATPYSGPLYIPGKAWDEEKDDRSDLVDTGAAARALECDWDIYSAGGSEPWSEGDGGTTPEDGLRAYFEIEQPDGPREGFRVEREEGGRVLYSYDVDGRTKMAVIVAKDRKNRPGWGPETSASCDPAEFRASWTDSQGYEIWTDRDGERVPVSLISSSIGPAHCDWQKAHFLSVREGKEELSYARDPDGVLGDDMLEAPYDGDVPLPADAEDTGYRLGERQLWLTDDKRTAYVRTPDGVEAWPQVKKGMGCA